MPKFEMLVLSYNPIAGHIVLARPLAQTNVILAGAINNVVKQLVKSYRFQRVLIDGALDRLVHAGILDGTKIFLVVHSESSESLKIVKKLVFASKLSKPSLEDEDIFKGLEGVWSLTKTGQLVKLADSCLTLKDLNQKELEWLYVSGTVNASLLNLRKTLKMYLVSPLSVAEVLDDFDNIYTMNRITLEKIFVDSSTQRDLSKKLQEHVEGLNSEIEDALSIEEV